MKKTSCNKNIEQTQFHSCTVFLCSKFKLEHIYSGVNFCGKNVHGNLFLHSLEISQKLEPAKILCYTVYPTFYYKWL